MSLWNCPHHCQPGTHMRQLAPGSCSGQWSQYSKHTAMWWLEILQHPPCLAPGKLPCTRNRHCRGGRSGCPHPGCSNLGKAHTGWEGRHWEVKLFARGHTEGRWFKCRHSFQRPPQPGTKFSPKPAPPPPSHGQSTVGSRGLTSNRCWQPCGQGLESHAVKNTLRMPFLNSDPARRCCCQPHSGTCWRGPLGRTQPRLCEDRGRR